MRRGRDESDAKLMQGSSLLIGAATRESSVQRCVTLEEEMKNYPESGGCCGMSRKWGMQNWRGGRGRF